LLERHGFTRGADSTTAQEVFRHWERRCSWRRDSYDLWNYRERPAGAKSQVSVDVVLDDGKTVDVHGGSVPWLLYRRHELLVYPGLEGVVLATSDERLLDRIVADAEKSLSWFDAYATPQKCIEQLKRTDRNGVGIGTAPYTRALEHLARIAAV
jgi:hypothetical protein